MSDVELRELERQIIAEPSSLELRRLHASRLLRSGDAERGLGALDLAWRLGAEDLWDQLRALLEARRVRVGAVTLCYVPGGPFVMGADDLDADASPAHLVNLSPFYVAQEPLTFATTQPEIAAGNSPAIRERVLARPAVVQYPAALAAIGRLNQGPRPDGLEGRWALITEAQWERTFRAAHARADGGSPYGAMPSARSPEWTADLYAPTTYAQGPRRDPIGPDTGELRVVRGVPGLPPPVFALYREAADPDGRFELGRRSAANETGILARPVFLPARSA